jgi:hypothetical protein
MPDAKSILCILFKLMLLMLPPLLLLLLLQLSADDKFSSYMDLTLQLANTQVGARCGL